MLNYASVLDRDANNPLRKERPNNKQYNSSKVPKKQLGGGAIIGAVGGGDHGVTSPRKKLSIGKCRTKIVTLLSLILLAAASVRMNVEVFSTFSQTPESQSMNVPKGEGRRFDVLKDVIAEITGSDDYRFEHNDTSTPQFRALDWMANWDKFNIGPEDPRLGQRYALAVLYYSTRGETTWKSQKKWLSPIHECEWNENGGVRKCNADGFVQDISLWNGLSGTIPTEIGLLTELRTLYLSRNKLTGPIPTDIGKLTKLEYLGLQHNKLSGTVPSFEFANMKRLKSFYMEKNDLSGYVRHVEPLCGLMKEGNLKYLTADCRTLVSWKEPEIVCACCTTCHLP